MTRAKIGLGGECLIGEDEIQEANIQGNLEEFRDEVTRVAESVPSQKLSYLLMVAFCDINGCDALFFPLHKKDVEYCLEEVLLGKKGKNEVRREALRLLKKLYKGGLT